MLQAFHNTENLCKLALYIKLIDILLSFYRCFKEGEKISAGDVLCEIQTDKVSSVLLNPAHMASTESFYATRGGALQCIAAQ